MGIFFDELIQFYLNNTINLRRSTQRIIRRPLPDHRLCDVTALYVVAPTDCILNWENSSMKTHSFIWLPKRLVTLLNV